MPRVQFKDTVDLEDETTDGGSESDEKKDDRSDTSSSDSYNKDCISCDEEDSDGETSHIPFASLSVTDKSSNMASTKKDKKKKKGSRRSSSDGYNVFDSLNIDEAPIARKQIIDGSIQTVYKGLYKGKDMGYHVLFVLEVPASITKKESLLKLLMMVWLLPSQLITHPIFSIIILLCLMRLVNFRMIVQVPKAGGTAVMRLRINSQLIGSLITLLNFLSSLDARWIHLIFKSRFNQ